MYEGGHSVSLNYPSCIWKKAKRHCFTKKPSNVPYWLRGLSFCTSATTYFPRRLFHSVEFISLSQIFLMLGPLYILFRHIFIWCAWNLCDSARHPPTVCDIETGIGFPLRFSHFWFAVFASKGDLRWLSIFHLFIVLTMRPRGLQQGPIAFLGHCEFYGKAVIVWLLMLPSSLEIS